MHPAPSGDLDSGKVERVEGWSGNVERPQPVVETKCTQHPDQGPDVRAATGLQVLQCAHRGVRQVCDLQLRQPLSSPRITDLPTELDFDLPDSSGIIQAAAHRHDYSYANGRPARWNASIAIFMTTWELSLRSRRARAHGSPDTERAFE
ncbi:hypothetical protein ASE24_15310 [Nocardioides sp. Root224]|nr:hypothetical protein ASE24_15310 [Nocardioides sp. Root224]